MASSNVIGIDLGGTKIAYARYATDGFTLEAEERVPTQAERGFPAVIEDMVERIGKMRTPETVAVGIGAPCFIRQPEGYILNTANIPGGRDIPLKAMLTERLGLRVAVENDANVFALAEAMLGAGKGKRVVVGITLGTGVGGGIVVDGKMYTGGNGFAAEVGHMLLVPGQPPYASDDPRGRVEQFISGTAMGKRLPGVDPREFFDGPGGEALRPQLFTEIAWFCVNLTYLLDPNVIVFGGSAGKPLTPHLETIRTEMAKWMLPHVPVPELAVAQVPHAGVVGAALAAAA